GIYFWRSVSAVLAVVALGAIVESYRTDATSINEPNATDTVTDASRMLAILQAPGQTSTPGWVVTQNAQVDIKLESKVNIEVPPDFSVHLWTYDDIDPSPRSLGVLLPHQAAVLPALAVGVVRPGQIFEMTLESVINTPAEVPKGSILFIGRTVLIDQ